MRVLFVTSELFPWVKQGGLGDVSGALPPALKALGADVRLFLPAYPALKAVFPHAVPAGEAPTLPGEKSAPVLLAHTPAGVPLYLLDAPRWFDRPGGIYDDDGGDGGLRWGGFGRAAAHFALGGAADGWRPQVVHGHDWQAGLVPAFLRYAKGPAPPVVFTIHNLAYQGLFAPALLPRLGLPPASFDMHGLEFHGKAGFLKAGLYYSQRLTTVSPTYAQEIQTEAQGCGLHGLLAGRREVLTGILNGVDAEHWNPRTNPHVPAPYDARTLAVKKENHARLCHELGLLQDSGGPLLCVISRLVHQKGLDLLLEALPAWVAQGGRLALLGQGEAPLEEGFDAAAARWPRRVAVRLGYDEALSVRLLAGSDAIAVPSRMEPCGLTQLYGLAFGALPIVRRTGGLADTVTDATAQTLTQKTATGFVFDDPTAVALEQTLLRAGETWRDQPTAWAQMQRQAMRQRFGWQGAAGQYLDVYKAAAGG